MKWRYYASYDGGMRTVGTAAAVGLATGVVGGVIGYFLLWHFCGFTEKQRRMMTEIGMLRQM